MEAEIARLAKKLWTADERLLVAVSTGVDSMSLLHVLEKLCGKDKLGVVHVNHGLRTASDQEEQFLTAYCQEKKLPLYKTRWLTAPATGIEAAAREFRYHFFAEVMAEQEYQVLLTAHHADDQMETVLMKLVREGNFFSSGGIRWTQDFGGGRRLVRPLLGITKEEILSYSVQQQLVYFEDESNASLKMQRNRLRQNVLPLLKEENPQVQQHFQQWSQQTFWAQEIIAEQQHNWLQQFVTEKNGLQFAVADYCSLTVAQRYFFLQAISHQLQQSGQISLSEKQLQQLMTLLEKSQAQWTIDLADNWHVQKSYQVVVFRQKIQREPKEYFLPLGADLFLSATEWCGFFAVGEEKIPEKVKLWSEYRQGLTVDFPPEILIRKRRAGDRIRLSPGLTKKVSRLFIDKKISNEQREQAWVITDQNGEVFGLLPYALSYLSIARETDKIHYVLLYRRMTQE